MSAGVSAPTLTVDDELLETFRAYQRSGTYYHAATQLGVSEHAVKKRLMRLYSAIHADNAIHASFLLRDYPY